VAGYVTGQPDTVRFKMRGTAALSAAGLFYLIYGHLQEEGLI
jgi:hypothetical protein